MTLQERRDHETAKYKTLIPNKNYANGFFGKDALDYIETAHPKTLLDLGCGRNLFVKAVRKRFPDIDAKGLDHVFPEADITAGMYDIPIEDGTIDMITAFDSLEHLLPEDVPTTFKEMKRISSPHGRFIFSISYVKSMVLVNGEQLHPTVRPREWWVGELSDHASSVVVLDKYILGSFREKEL